MGRPKLTLSIQGVTVIAHVITALRDGGAGSVVVVGPPPDAPGARALIAEAERAGADVVALETPTPDMRASIQAGLDHLDRTSRPDAILLTPGDFPGVSAALVSQVVAQSRIDPTSIVIPTYHGRGGHPMLLPWDLAAQIRLLPAGVGVNALLAERPDRVRKWEVDEIGAILDLDTPEDLRYWNHGR